MGKILFVKKTPLDIFYKRRIARTFPAAHGFLMFWLLVKTWRLRMAPSDVYSTLACFLFYINYYIAIRPGVEMFLPAHHFWSLCVEEHTYIALSIMALLARWTKASPMFLLCGAVGLCGLVTIYLGEAYHWDYFRVYWRSDTRASSIMAGAIAVCLTSSGIGASKNYFGIESDWLGLGLLSTGVLCHLDIVPDPVKYSIGTAVVAVSIVLISQHITACSVVFRPLIGLGQVSYSLYLWQQPFYYFKGGMGVATAVAGALLFGLGSYFVIERPARRWLNAWWTPDVSLRTGNDGDNHSQPSG